MKFKKRNKKLTLNKRTIADVATDKMAEVKGGRVTFTCDFICLFTDGCYIYNTKEQICYMVSAPPLKTRCEICIP